MKRKALNLNKLHEKAKKYAKRSDRGHNSYPKLGDDLLNFNSEFVLKIFDV